jgi:hypothetical protein
MKTLYDLLVLNDTQTYNVFDESDALLSHKYQLVYAIGTPKPLDHVLQRSDTIQALLRVLNNPKNKLIQTLLDQPEYAVRTSASSSSSSLPTTKSKKGVFQSFRILPVNALDPEKQELWRKKLHVQIFTDLLEDLPYELKWLKTSYDSDDLDEIREAILDHDTPVPKKVSLVLF